MAEKQYPVKSPVKHGGTRHIDGTVTMDEKLAEPLIKSGVLGKATDAPAANTGPTDEAERKNAIKVAISQLDKADTTKWTGAGVPRTDALQVVLGWAVSGAERDAAWAEVQAESKAE